MYFGTLTTCLDSGADPEAGKGRDTNVGGWGEPDSLVNCCIFKAGNNHLFSVSLLILPLWHMQDGCNVLKAV